MKPLLNAWAKRLPVPPELLLFVPFWCALPLTVQEARSGEVALGLAAFAASLLSAAGVLAVLQAGRRKMRLVEESVEQRLRAHTLDEITGVLTRRVFVERAEERLRLREASECVAFLSVDLDYLKTVNDGFGHKAGDAILHRLASVLRELSPDGLVGRVGGDEFAMLVPCPRGDEVERLSERLYAALGKPVESGGRTFAVSATAGAVMVPAQALYLTQAMQFADLALYEAKRQGRGRLVRFDETMLQALKRHRLIERELRAALLLDELDLHYQPIVDAHGRVFAMEALMRWESPSRGPISPSEFIPVAESSHLIDQIGAWALGRACRDALEFGDVRVCVNVSARQLKRDDVVQAVEEALRQTGLAADRLVIELTESVAIDATDAIQERLTRLRAMGVAISLDDFGTGFSGFDYLRHLPVDKIKIDRSYIARLGESEADNVLVSALANVARAMRMTVVAEGIENHEQFILARSAGTTLFQGYHIARPAPKAAVIEHWIRPGRMVPARNAYDGEQRRGAA